MAVKPQCGLSLRSRCLAKAKRSGRGGFSSKLFFTFRKFQIGFVRERNISQLVSQRSLWFTTAVSVPHRKWHIGMMTHGLNNVACDLSESAF